MNRLADSTSPYLRQHKDNPVDWEEWGERAFERARAENKPVLLSVGYAACHWCHVMAHESFESEEIARQINDGFVAIKVDREERPDIDQVYQHAIQLLGVGGGWPLTAFLLPDGRPFYGGTYFPPRDLYGRPGFPKVLAGVRDAWENRRNEVDSNADELTRAVREIEALPPETGEVVGDVSAAATQWLLRRVDPENGGFGTRPKFPNSMAIEALLRFAAHGNVTGAREAALFTLGKMAEGGIYDQLGGGFHRYSVDERWHVPHFEKMLYDNALLAKSYTQAWTATGLDWCRHIAEETLEYLLREMRSPEGLFYASTDADSAPPSDPTGHPEEGLFFVWSQKEVMDLFGPDAGRIWCLRYEVLGDSGNWEEGRNVLHLAMREDDIAAEVGKPVEEVRQTLADARRKLFAEREKRPRPFRDEKLLTSWNALAISAFSAAGAAFGRPEFVEAASAAADSILRASWVDTADGSKRLLRVPDPGGGRPNLVGTLDDYANFAEALVDLWTATLDPRWLDAGEEIAGAALDLFAGGDGELYLTARDGEALVHRPLSLHDQSLPAGSGVIAHAWLRLGRLRGREDLERAARKTLDRHRKSMQQQPFAFGAMLNAWDTAQHPVDVVLSGPEDPAAAEALLAKVRRSFLPSLALHLAVGAEKPRAPIAQDKPFKDGAPTLYVCKDRTCSLPVTTAEELAPLL